ncbi:MAG TPA: glutathione transferase GstA [Bdellovibrionales bacterium]|nr:glutathione transferase GstA [Bdellovibrionales bacterium]
MRLYYSPGACSLAPQIVLRELGRNFEIVKVDIRNKTTETGGDYTQINPKGYVPALKLDDGEMLTENAVILQWLADSAPEKKLFPKLGTMERYHAMEWLNFIATELHKGFGTLFNPALGDEGRRAVIERLQLRLKYFNEHMATNQFVLGAEFSIADAYAYNVLRWATPLKVDISGYAAILGFMERVAGRPAVRMAVDVESGGKA